tara:strand:- start:173 stop:1078 length:906 start_codon:yes stop_codon:yes gene_type:complete
MSIFFTNLLQRLLGDQDIRRYKKNFLYYIIFRLVRRKLTRDLKVKIHNFYIWASFKKNKQSHSILRKCDFEDLQEFNLIEKIYSRKKILLFDCGANFGFYSLYVASKSNQNKIYSFEASPSTYEDLKKNINLNNFNNINSFNIAISDKKDKEIEFVESINDWESSLSNSNFEIVNKVKIKTNILDDFNDKDLDKINDYHTIIKLDVEGHEMNVLKGGSELIKLYSPLIIIEFSKFIKDEDYKIMKSFIDLNNYAVYDSKYNLINIEIVKDRLNELPKNMFGIGNNFLIQKNSDLETLVKKN